MNKFAKISGVALLAVSLAVPATTVFAAATAPVTTSTAIAKVSAVPAGQLVSLVGFGSSANTAAITAGNVPVKVVNVNDIYDLDTLNELDDALTSTKRHAVSQLRANIASDPATQAWFAQNGLSTNDVLAVSSSRGSINVYVQ